MIEDGGGCYCPPLKLKDNRSDVEQAADTFINPNIPNTAVEVIRKLREINGNE